MDMEFDGEERAQVQLEPFNFKINTVEQLCDSSIHSPVARSGHRIVHSLDDKYIYVYGGFSDSLDLLTYGQVSQQWAQTKPLFQELWRFCKNTKQWEYLETQGQSPKEVASHCMVMLNETNLLVYGGTRYPFGRIKNNKIYLCDLIKKKWSLIKNNDNEILPTPQYGQAILYDRPNKQLYVCGGTNGNVFSLELYRFDFNLMKWEQLYSDEEDQLLGPRYRHEIALWNNKIFVCGGASLATSYSNENIPVFDLENRQWTLKKSKPYVNAQGQETWPLPRYSHEGGQLGGRMYICGGTDGLLAHKDIWYLDLETLTWCHMEHVVLPHPIYFHSASMSSAGELVIFGGVTNIEPKIRTNALYSIWFKIPSLFTIAAFATLYQVRSWEKATWKPKDESELQEEQAKRKRNLLEFPSPILTNIQTKFVPLNTCNVCDFFKNKNAGGLTYRLFSNHPSMASKRENSPERRRSLRKRTRRIRPHMVM